MASWIRVIKGYKGGCGKQDYSFEPKTCSKRVYVEYNEIVSMISQRKLSIMTSNLEYMAREV